MTKARKNPREKFLDAIDQILSKTDLQQLDRSCNDRDGAYAMEVLKKMHGTFTKVYGADTLQEGAYDLVELPAVLRGPTSAHPTPGTPSRRKLCSASRFTWHGMTSPTPTNPT